MELLLWRWSTAVQVTSLVMIAAFFCLLSRSVRMAALRWWVAAWLANLSALAVTVGFWIFQPTPNVLRFVAGPLYMGLKAAFVLLLLQGAWALRRVGGMFAPPRVIAASVVAYAVAAPVFIDSLYKIGIVQHTAMGTLLVAGGVVLISGRDAGLPWLAIGCLVRGGLAFTESAAYGLGLASAGEVHAGLATAAATFLSAASSFDSAAEWLLALGCVLALSERVQRELLESNAELLVAQEDVRRLADRDPLTGLDNRRALPEVFRAVQPAGATLLFFDLDRFKQINDRHGHAAGDETLRRFAAGLKDCFRPGDALVRYAGDEFVVVASGLDPAAAADRISALRERLRRFGDGPAIVFSVGVAQLPPGGRPEDALRDADDAMYADKHGRPGAGARRPATSPGS